MRKKKVLAWLICLSLVLSLALQSGSTAGASAESKPLDTITLKESPYAIGEGWMVDTRYSSQSPYAMAKGKKEYLAVGAYGSVMKSTDGVNWRALSRFEGYQLTAIAWDGSKYVLFGTDTEYAFTLYKKPSEAFLSADGLTWTKIDFDPGETIHQVVWGKSGYVAIGDKHIFTSKDGKKWTTSRTLYNEYGANTLHYVNGTYFISSRYDNLFVLVSKDG